MKFKRANILPLLLFVLSVFLIPQNAASSTFTYVDLTNCISIINEESVDIYVGINSFEFEFNTGIKSDDRFKYLDSFIGSSDWNVELITKTIGDEDWVFAYGLFSGMISAGSTFVLDYVDTGIGNLKTDYPTITQEIDVTGMSRLDTIELPNLYATPIPSAVWLFGSGIIGLVGLRRKFKK